MAESVEQRAEKTERLIRRKIAREAAEETDIVMSPVVGAVLTKMFEDRTAVEKQIEANYRNQIADLQAELEVIRTGVDRLFETPFMPREAAIIRAVFSPDQVSLANARNRILREMEGQEET